jgi:tetratricopeptide (TPR) repeat protein
VQVLMALADVGDSEDDRLALLDQVLEVQRHPAAETARRQIWTERGDRAKKAGRLEEALDAYRAAGVAELEKQIRDDLQRREIDEAMQRIETLERQDGYVAAYDKLRKLADQFPDFRDWRSDLQRLEGASYLETAYWRTFEEIGRGERDAAIRTLLEVLGRDPGYRDATARLHMLVTGVDVKAVEESLSRQKRAWVKIEQEREDTTAQIASLRQEVDAAHRSTAGIRAKQAEMVAKLEAAEATAAEAARSVTVAESEKKRVEKERDEVRARRDILRGEVKEVRSQLEELIGMETAFKATLKRRPWWTVATVSGYIALLSILISTCGSLDTTRKTLGAEVDGARAKEEETQKKLEETQKKLEETQKDFDHAMLVVTERPLTLVSAAVYASVLEHDNTCHIWTTDSNGLFSEKRTCAVWTKLTLRNNFAHIKTLEGWLCVKYIKPDNTIEVALDAAPSQGGSECTIGFPINIHDKPNWETETVTLDQESISLQQGIGHTDGSGYSGEPGKYRVELWWQEHKIGETGFTIVP